MADVHEKGGEEFGPKNIEGPFLLGTDTPIALLGDHETGGIVAVIDAGELEAVRHSPEWQAFAVGAIASRNESQKRGRSVKSGF